MTKNSGSKPYYGIRCTECGSQTDVYKSTGKRGEVCRARRCQNQKCRTRMLTKEVIVRTISPDLAASAPIPETR